MTQNRIIQKDAPKKLTYCSSDCLKISLSYLGRSVNQVIHLYWWSKNAALTLKGAQEHIRGLGSQPYDTFIGPDGKKVLESIVPTSVLLNVDETILNLPWELIRANGGSVTELFTAIARYAA